MTSLRVLLCICTPVPFSHAQTTPTPAAVSAATSSRSSGLARINDPRMKTFNPGLPAVLAPKLVKQADPEFPEEARNGELSATVNVTMTVDEAGKPQDIHVDTPVGHGFDEAALRAIRQYRFKPATRDGKPVPVALRVEVAFKRP